MIGENTPVSVTAKRSRAAAAENVPAVWEDFMIAKLMATVALALAVSAIARADEPKHGGILHIYHRETNGCRC